MWEEPEKDKGRDTAGQEGGGGVDREKGEGKKGKRGRLIGKIRGEKRLRKE